jgi:hypothetical protein
MRLLLVGHVKGYNNNNDDNDDDDNLPEFISHNS